MDGVSTGVRAFVQARMSSARFPGKVLAPLAGTPLLAHVIGAVSAALPLQRITIATSDQPSDDPVACYARQLGVAVVRGPLDDVVARLRQCVEAWPCDWFVRVCADSPFVDGALIARMVELAQGSDLDLVTNVQRRTFPKGQSVEVLRTSTFMGLEQAALTRDDREHVTRYYYAHPGQFRIRNVEREGESLGHRSVVVDTLEDLRRLEDQLRVGAAS